MVHRQFGAARQTRLGKGAVLVVGAAVVLIGILLVSGSLQLATLRSATLFGGVAPGPLTPPTTNTSGPHLSAAQCLAEEPNASLVQIVVHIYEGNGNASGPGSGLINQGPPGASAYPSEATAEANMINGWSAVCESAAYYALVQQWGAPNYPVNALAQNRTGIYEGVVAVSWSAPLSACPSNQTSSPRSTGECFGIAQWLINVASGVVSGPTTTYFSPRVPGL